MQYPVRRAENGKRLFVAQTVVHDDAGFIDKHPGCDQQAESYRRVKRDEAITVGFR
ncbi:hypothetical protein PQR71_16475 [Paraburkholderia fungorum]|uniref:hypothetical protein n=1 Tax=Paraburkholderia fungorum TaxID=134537 RepID=UPI0038BBE041